MYSVHVLQNIIYNLQIFRTRADAADDEHLAENIESSRRMAPVLHGSTHTPPPGIRQFNLIRR